LLIAAPVCVQYAAVKLSPKWGVKKKGIVSNVDLFSTCSKVPLGKHVFKLFVAAASPYSASIGPNVESLEYKIQSDPSVTNPDNTKTIYCKTSMQERPWLRNPFKSIHAAALINLGEFTSGLAMVSAFQSSDMRGIVNSLSGTYTKKARGLVTAIAEVALPPSSSFDSDGTCKYFAVTKIFDSSGEQVATVTAEWVLSKTSNKKKL